MSFRREGDNVVITLTQEQFDSLLMALGVATGTCMRQGGVESSRWVWMLVNAINEGNPKFRPYEIPKGDGHA